MELLSNIQNRDEDTWGAKELFRCFDSPHSVSEYDSMFYCIFYSKHIWIFIWDNLFHLSVHVDQIDKAEDLIWLIEIKVELILRLPHDANIAGQLFINKHA